MFLFIFRRLLYMIPALLALTAIIFILVRMSGDPVILMLPEDATLEQIEQLRHHLGLDKPIYEQYVRFISQLLRGDFGESIRYSNTPVLPLVLERLPATLELASASILIALLISLIAGVSAALFPRTIIDYFAAFLSMLGEAMPNFWLGIMMILLFSVRFEITPVSGRGGLAHMILPAIALGTSLAAILTRMMRSSLLEVLSQDFIRTARAKGLHGSIVLFKHALRNALLPYITILGLQMASLMAGAVVTEQVFAWPGVGLLAVQAINSRDMAVIQALVLIISLVVMVTNIFVDALYSLIDPRIRYA